MVNLRKHPFNYVLSTRFKLRLIVELIGQGKNKSLLDIGCGSGFILSQIEDQFDKVVGIDPSKKVLNFAKKYTKAKLIIAEAEELPFKNNSFDCIVSTDAFEHVVDDKKALKEVKRLLKPGGIFIVYVPCLQGILSKTKLASLFHSSTKNYLLDRRYYTIGSLKKLVKQAGLKIEYLGFHNIFFQEFFTQVLKWTSFKLGKKYENQADIKNFINSPFFPFYRWFLLPVIDFLVFLEELICQNLFKAKIPGHRIILKAKKIK